MSPNNNIFLIIIKIQSLTVRIHRRLFKLILWMSLGTRKNTKDYPNHAFNLSRESDLNDKFIFLYDLHCLSEHRTGVSTLVHVHARFV